jgi:hypothetical protein
LWPNSATHQNDHIPWSGQFHFGDAEMVQINMCNTAYRWKQVQKHLSRCRKSFWQNTTSFLFFI